MKNVTSITPSAPAHALYTDGHESAPLVSPRDYSDRARLQRLYTLGVALQVWAARFDGHLVTAIASQCVDNASLQKLLAYVNDHVESFAPEAVTSAVAGRGGKAAERDLDQVVSSLLQLPAYIDDHFNFNWLPADPFFDHGDEGTERLAMEWVPPETHPAMWFRDAVKEPVAAASALTNWHECDPRIVRVARLGANAVQELITHIDSDGRGGFARSRVEDFLHALPHDSAIRRIHEQFVFTLDALASLAHRQDAGQAQHWVMLTQYLHARYGEWSDRCFAPTVTGRSRHSIRSTRQSKKDTLRRLVAKAGQYGTLLQGVVAMPRMAATIQSLSVLGQRLALRVKKVHAAVVRPDASEVHRQMRLLDQQVVTASDLEHWARCLGPRAEACGRLVELIACGEVPQSEPWEPKEHASQLKTAAIFERTDPDKEFNEIRLRMQEAGIAVQAPWKYIEGKRAEPETKKGVADKWLLNPMAQILASVAD